MMFTFGRRFPKNSHCFFASQKLIFAFKFRRAVSPSKIKTNTFRRRSIQNSHCFSSTKKKTFTCRRRFFKKSDCFHSCNIRPSRSKRRQFDPLFLSCLSRPPPNRHSTSLPRDVRPLPCTRTMFVTIFVVVVVVELLFLLQD